MEERSSIRRSAIKPIEPNKQTEKLYYCDDCFKTIYKEDCDKLFACVKCNIKLCVDCYNACNKCENCNQRFTTFLKKDDIRKPEKLTDFVAIKQKKRSWSCLFCC